MERLKAEMELQQAIQNEKILIVQFGAESCAPCHAIRNKIDAWNQTGEAIYSLYIPVEEFSELAAQSSVFAVPTILVYVEGKLAIRESGYFGLEPILQKIRQYQKMLQE